MHQAGSWGPAVINPLKPQFKWDVFAYPPVGKYLRARGGPLDGIVVVAKTKNKEWALGFIELALSEGHQALLPFKCYLLPPEKLTRN